MIAKKSSLGRGLGALIEDVENNKPVESVASINEIDINSIEINPFQPRKTFDEEALQELSASIRQLGIIQPITVRKINENKYQLITGERRFRASQLAGLDTIPAYVRIADDQAMLELALVENIQREDLDAIEIAISYQRLIDECALTQENMSDRVGKKRSTIANYLRLLKLPAEIQAGIRLKKITMGHARALVNIDDVEKQLSIYHHVIEEELSVRAIEDIVRNLSEPKEDNNVVDKRSMRDLPMEYVNYRDNLRTYFKTRVQLSRNDKGSGKIVIPFNSDVELKKIVEMIQKIDNPN
ncbi:MAG TPA: ParB/RepB/Spo0J family partition protein [Bacteroidales bacterium]|nr:ParB/RepB/Spo0J family partition protein [Bacteroidales bacterium]